MRLSTKTENWISQIDAIRKHFLAWLKVFIILLLIIYPFNRELYQLLSAPLMLDSPHAIISTRVVSPFTTPLRLSIFTAFSASMPALLWQLWRYLKPAMQKNERYLLSLLMFSGTILFLSGVIFCFIWVLPSTIKVFQRLTPNNVMYMPDMDAYLDFALSLAMAFGLSFEFPVILITLVKLKILKLSDLVERRREVIVLCFVIAMLVTPPDVTSQILLAIPMIALYELSIIICKITTRSDNFS